MTSTCSYYYPFMKCHYIKLKALSNKQGISQIQVKFSLLHDTLEKSWRPQLTQPQLRSITERDIIIWNNRLN